MSMLAEKKSRTKWSVNPRGNFWAKDENKFGQKMLEKMGWSPGSGLGIRGQGSTEIIKINVKNDTRGLGKKSESGEEKWVKQLVDFDSLLSKLNGEEKKERVSESLEEKSKTSRVRIHYKKFTRGKDVSKYSSKDLNCILPLKEAKEEEKVGPTQNNMYTYFGEKPNNPYKQELVSREAELQDRAADETLADETKSHSKKKKRKHTQPEEEPAKPSERKKKIKSSNDGQSPRSEADVGYLRNSNEEDRLIDDDQSFNTGIKLKNKKRKQSLDDQPTGSEENLDNLRSINEDKTGDENQYSNRTSKSKKKKKKQSLNDQSPGSVKTLDNLSINELKEEDNIGNEHQYINPAPKTKKKKRTKIEDSNTLL